MQVQVKADPVVPTRVRYLILLTIFALVVLNYSDRATLSIAGPAAGAALGLGAVQMGFVFSAFSWSYTLAQIPGGWLLDRFGSRQVYVGSVLLWSVFTLMQGLVGFVTGLTAVLLLFALRFLVGLAEAPAFPANSRIVAAWFPTKERGTAAAVFNSGQYFATVLFSPFMAWLVSDYGWQSVFYVMGGLGLVLAVVAGRVLLAPDRHPNVNRAELDYLRAGGALVDLESDSAPPAPPSVGHARQLLSSRMMLGIYAAQYCVNVLTYFFLTWFPIYLVTQRGMSILQAGFIAAVPGIAGFAGGLTGGVLSDLLLRRGISQNWARKGPIVLGMLASTAMILCNYVDISWMVVAIMAFSFFGKGLGALGWAVIADTAPREAAGLCAGIFNTAGNLAGITTPIVIGYIVQTSASFNGALVYVAANAVAAALLYLFVVGDIKRLVLR